VNGTPDFLVIGGGVIGLCTALALRDRFAKASIMVIEKEARCGMHASGRNSGVLHAGFYYGEDSLKARFSVQGNRRMTEFCEARSLPINRCGKLVVSRNEAEEHALDELLRRGQANGVDVELISADDAREIEPRVRTTNRALFSPTTASVNPGLVMGALESDVRSRGCEVLLSTSYRGRDVDGVRTSAGTVSAGFVVNAAGLHADRVARDFGFSEHHRILPFKGLYLHSDEPPGSLRTHVYPVPDLDMPFLGVHMTLTADGRTMVGPTAMPALWRENYGGMAGFSGRELAQVVAREAALFARNVRFRRLARRELPKMFRRVLAGQASELITGVRQEQFRLWGRPGIRAQLLDTRSGQLDMDFRVQGDAHSTHVLNAVSPAFTCAFPFAEWLVAQI